MKRLMRSVKLCQPTVTSSGTNGRTITLRSQSCRWFYFAAKQNNSFINYNLTLEAFTIIHFKSFPQFKCEIRSLTHLERHLLTLYQSCQLITSTYFNKRMVKKIRLYKDLSDYLLINNF